MRILITGATGNVGIFLVDKLYSLKHQLYFFTTSLNKLNFFKNKAIGYYWNPSKDTINSELLCKIDCIIHLAGSSIAKPWTSSYKKKIFDSRILSTEFLFDKINAIKNKTKIRKIISASAIGIYPDSSTEFYKENSLTIANNFIQDLVYKWERSVDRFKEIGIKVCKLRIGLVLIKKSGILKPIELFSKLNIGLVFGDGKQFQSWIHIEDLILIIVFVIENKLTGIYNCVAPNPVNQKTLTREILLFLTTKHHIFYMSKKITRLLMGEMSILVLDSQNVSSKKIEKNGFIFKYRLIHNAIKSLYIANK
tara:strand:- start:20727 stop:21650 length:924 start_codon:yes stop_codon:yes gene_type:complete